MFFSNLDYGHAEYNIRKNNRNMSLADASAGIMDKTTLRKFEKGEISLSMAKLFPLLRRLRVAPSEFLYQGADFAVSPVASFFEELAAVYVQRDMPSLRRMLADAQRPRADESARLPFQRLDRITIEAAIKSLGQGELAAADVEFVTAYLVGQRNWFYYDLSILQYLPNFLSPETLI